MAYGCQMVGRGGFRETVAEVVDSAVEGARLASVLAFGEQSGA